MSAIVELVVTAPGGEVAIVEVEPAVATIEDILILSEVQLGIPCAELEVEVERPRANGLPSLWQRLRGGGTLAALGITAEASIRLVAASVGAPPPAASAPSQQSPAKAPPAAPTTSATGSRNNSNNATATTDPAELIRQLFAGGAGAQRTNGGGNNGAGAAPVRPPLDPMDPDYQRRLYEQIQQENVMRNFEQAMEHTPEAFGRVVMLYVPAAVNRVPLTAFVDSGAQMTIMNEATAEKCGILHLLDRRMTGIAKGAGEAKIIGRIHMAMVSLGGLALPMSITVLESKDMEFLIGLDQLRRHQMAIDLKHNVLAVADGVSVPFLGEGDLPEHIRNGAGGHGGDAHDPDDNDTPATSK